MAKVYCGDRTRDVELLQDRAARGASALEALGIGHRDTVAIYLRNDFPHLETSLAAGKLGAYVVPVNWHSSPSEARYILEDSGAKVVVIHADLLAGIADAIPETVKVIVVETPEAIVRDYGLNPDLAILPKGVQSWDDLLARFEPLPPRTVEAPGSIIYTSGTTGRPKGVRRAPFSETQAAATAELVRTVFGLGEWMDRLEDVVLEVGGPLYHSGPNAWSLQFVQLGANVLLDTRFDPERTLSNIERFKVTHFLAVPTMFVRLLHLPEEVRRQYDLSSLTFVIHGAAPCPVHAKKAMIDWWGPIFWETYGSTEVGSITNCGSEEWLAHPGTVGKGIAETDIRILDANGEELPPGEIGEIAARRRNYGDFTYHGDDEKRRSIVRRDGLVAMGDTGYLDKDGYLYLSGRASDMVISGGVNIYPAEIEAELLKMPGVVDCAVFGIPDDEFGEKLCAFIQPQPDRAPGIAEVQSFIRERLSAYKVPRRVEFSAELPREDSGKIFKRKLRAPFWEKAGRQI